MCIYNLQKRHVRLPFNDFNQRVKAGEFITPKLLSDGPPVSIDKALSMIGEFGFHGALEPVEVKDIIPTMVKPVNLKRCNQFTGISLAVLGLLILYLSILWAVSPYRTNGPLNFSRFIPIFFVPFGLTLLCLSCLISTVTLKDIRFTLLIFCIIMFIHIFYFWKILPSEIGPGIGIDTGYARASNNAFIFSSLTIGVLCIISFCSYIISYFKGDMTEQYHQKAERYITNELPIYAKHVTMGIVSAISLSIAALFFYCIIFFVFTSGFEFVRSFYFNYRFQEISKGTKLSRVQNILGDYQWRSSCAGPYVSRYVKGKNHSGCETILLFYTNQSEEQWEVSFDGKNTVLSKYHYRKSSL